MIKAEIRDIEETATANVDINGKPAEIIGEYMELVKGLKIVIAKQIGEEKAKSFVEDITRKALSEDIKKPERMEEQIKKKIDEIKNHPQKTEKLLKILFED